MTTVSVTTLKAHLSHYLALVKRGHEIVVTSHWHPVARLLPPAALAGEIIESIRPVKDVLQLTGVHRRRATSAVETLLADRRRR